MGSLSFFPLLALSAATLFPAAQLAAQTAAPEASTPSELPMGYQPPAGEDAGRLIVLNKSAHTASVVDVASGEIVADIPTGVGPHEVAIHPVQALAVVADYGDQRTVGQTLTVIDLASLKVVRTIDLGTAIRPHGLAFEPDGEHLWVSAETQRQLWRVNFESGKAVAKVDSQANATHMVAYGASGQAFSANIADGSTSVVVADGEGGYKLQAEVKTGAGAEGVCVTPNGKHAWFSNRAADTVSVVDTETLEVVHEFECKGFPIRAMAAPDGRTVVVSSAMASKITVFDAQRPSSLAAITMPFQSSDDQEAILGGMNGSTAPIGMTYHPNSKLVFVANATVNRVAVVDLVLRKVVAQLPTGANPDGIAWVPSPRE